MKMSQPYFYHPCIEGEDNVKRLVTGLVELSCWFMITPLPDDLWTITVKPQNQWRLNKLFRECGIEIARTEFSIDVL